MKHALPIIIAFLLTLSLALAVSIQITKTDYAQGEILTAVIGNCAAGSVLEIYNAKTPVPTLIYTRQGNAQWQATYNTNSDSSDGRYTLFASCEDGTTTKQAFCVDAPGCLVTGDEEEQMELRLTSSAFNNLQSIPEENTCDGDNINPPLQIRNIPSNARSVTLIMDDPDANSSRPAVHWTVFNIPVSGNSLDLSSRASFRSPTTMGINEVDNGRSYAGPCPPEGETHRYRFKVYALDVASINPSTIQDDNDVVRASALESRFDANILDEATLNGYYYPQAAAPADAGVSRGGYGGCLAQWSCSSPWNYCNATLQQSRTCTDLNRCDQRKLTKIENRSCVACEESWVCTAWNDCQNGQQRRDCSDEHSCMSVTQKPLLQKSCAATETGPAPVRVEPRLPLPQVQQPLPPVPSFWDSYKLFIIGIPAALIVIALMALGAVHFFKPKQVAYNVEELKEWIRKEQQMGTSQEDIKNILGQHTGWSKDEMEAMFAELGKRWKISSV